MSAFFGWLFVFTVMANVVNGQDESVCYGPGSIAISVLLSILLTVLILAGLYLLWKRLYRHKNETLILETDPEKGKGEYAFDNPGFKDAGLTPIAKALDKNGTNNKWNHWSPLAVLTTKSEKQKKTLDDSAIDAIPGEVKVVELRSHDFTGLGFNICGNMKEGIYIKDVLHRGPASESGKLNPGDRINSVTISFEHMVYEDALTILSYASPYEVIIEARGGKIIHPGTGQGAQPTHPVYRSTSCTELLQFNSSGAKKRLFEDHSGSVSSNYSSLQKSRSNMTTLERRESESPKVKPNNHHRPKKIPPPEILKTQLEQRIAPEHHTVENKLQKFGIRVLPTVGQKSPKIAEQNENNINIEKQPLGVDEVDENLIKAPPQAKKRERKPEITPEHDGFIRNDSGIKRDHNGIPQEIPSFMMNAAVAARTNRKNSEDHQKTKEDEEKMVRKSKGKAPSPPEEKTKSDLDEIHSAPENSIDLEVKPSKDNNLMEEIEVELRAKNNKDYNSDSDLENDNESSVNTIELNSSDITIHQAEENEERKNRKTASTGDLTKMQKTRKSSTGTLERAQSLDNTDAAIPTLRKKRKGGRIEDDMESDEDIFSKVMLSKEPRLSLILDGLNTFQRNRLKKSTEWGNLEDAILKLNQEDEPHTSSEEFTNKPEEFDALVNKINEIKRESMDIRDELPVNSLQEVKPDVIQNGGHEYHFSDQPPVKPAKKSKTLVSSDEVDACTVKKNADIDEIHVLNEESGVNENTCMVDEVKTESSEPEEPVKKVKNCIWPFIPVDPKINGDAVEDNSARLAAAEKRQRKPAELSAEPPTKPQKKGFFPFKKIDKKKDSDPNSVSRNFADITRNFIFTEKIACGLENEIYDDTNVSDDIKVSRHNLGSLERPKCDDAKMENVCNVTVLQTNGHQEGENPEETLHSLDLEINQEPLNHEDSELYTTALDNTVKPTDTSTVTISTPDLIKNVTITEAINTLNNDVMVHGPSSLTLEIPRDTVEQNKTYSVIDLGKNSENNTSRHNESEEDQTQNSSLTYITEIQVLTPNNNSDSNNTNISEIEIIPSVNNNNSRNLQDDFEDYVRNFESNVRNFESTIEKFENNIDTTPSLTLNEDSEKELSKIQSIAEEQLKKLPEMRFTTSSYESPRTPEKRHSQIEILRSNFEKSPAKQSKSETKSRIPIATTGKTPPTSPERRDSRTSDMEPDILELMASPAVHSTPMKFPGKSNKNVTVTSIRSNSKIPSGLPILGGANSRPPIPPRRQDSEDHVVQVSTNADQSSFKQWVFNPSDHAVTNIVVSEGKLHK